MSLSSLEALARRIRDPASSPLPEGTDTRRVGIYESLFFNTLKSFIDSGFPVMRQCVGEDAWGVLIRDFMRTYRCQSPYFLDIGAEFLDWLPDALAQRPSWPPFLQELAHYERVELDLDIAENVEHVHGWSPLAWPLAYTWPVHRLSPDWQPALPPDDPTLLLVWRDAALRVRFQSLSPLAFALASALHQGQPLAAALTHLQQHTGATDPERFNALAEPLLQQWRDAGIWCDEA